MLIEPPQIAGLVLIALLMLVIGWIGLRRQPRTIVLFALALCVVGLGYLATTRAPTALARALFGAQY